MQLPLKVSVLSVLLAASLLLLVEPAPARTLLGISSPAETSEASATSLEMAARIEEAFGNLVAVHNYHDKSTLLSMLLQFSKLDAVLISRPTFDLQPPGVLIALAEVQVSGPEQTTLVLATRADLSEGQRHQLVQGYQELLLSADGLGLLELYATREAAHPSPGSAPTAAGDQPAADGLRATLEASAATVGDFRAPPAPEEPPAQRGPAPMAAAQAPLQPVVADDNPAWRAHVDLQGKLGNDRSLSQAELFLPLAQTRDRLLFLDLRFQLDDSSSNEGSFGLGFRKIINDEWILGGYGFYDLRRSGHGNSFKQVAFGVEALSATHDARINVYLADKEDYLIDKQQSLDQIVYSGAYLVHQTGGPAYETREKSMSGFDAEVGWILPWFTLQEVHGYLGGYHFSAAGMDDMSGPRARLEVRFPGIFGWRDALFELGGELTHDQVRQTDYFISMRARFPFGTTPLARESLTGLGKRMNERIQRDTDIVVGRQHRDSSSPVRDEILTDDSRPITFTHVDSQGGIGNGSFETPFNALAPASSSGSSIVLLYADSAFSSEGITLTPGQRLLGEAAGHTINTDQFGLISLPRVSGGTAPPLIDNVATAVELADGSEVSGIMISNAEVAIYGREVGGINVNRVAIANVSDGIFLDGLVPNAQPTTIAGNTLQAVSYDGIAIYNDDTTGVVAADITDNLLQDLGTSRDYGAGIYLENNGLDLRVSLAGNRIEQVFDEGILGINTDQGTTFSVLMRDNHVERTGLEGVFFENSGATTNLYLQNNRTDGDSANGYADYYIINLGSSFNLGATAGNPVIGSAATDSDQGVVLAEGNTRADGLTEPAVEAYGDISIIDQATIPRP